MTRPNIKFKTAPIYRDEHRTLITDDNNKA